MLDLFVSRLAISGIKSIEDEAVLEFSNQVITKEFDKQKYNIKGIYGMNGSGKSGIIEAVKILKQLICNTDYLNNSIVQRNLNELINKNKESLSISIDYLEPMHKQSMFRYSVELKKNKILNKYLIASETLSCKSAISRKSKYTELIDVKEGRIVTYNGDNCNEFFNLLSNVTMNLLDTASVCSLFIERVLFKNKEISLSNNKVANGLALLFIFATNIYVHMDIADDHTEYLIQDFISDDNLQKLNSEEFNKLVDELTHANNNQINSINPKGNEIRKNQLENYKKVVNSLTRFIQIFKPELKDIEIESKETIDTYKCSLIMVYQNYRVNAEYESTGIKKLMELFVFFRAMVNGCIVFIDELDSNLHDVYLCALLEYLKEYGKGQLCFTTHNVGPMDVLRNNKKSIDFLSSNQKIYPWIKNGNYSPAKLYKSGMIEGSPFNINYFDFIGILDNGEEN